MTIEQALEKVRKLLDLANGAGTEAEAAAALAKADALMAEYDLAREDIASRGTEGWAETELAERDGYTFTPAEYHAGQVLISCFHVAQISSRRADFERGVMVRKATLFGRRHHVAVAALVQAFLVRTFERLWDRHRKAERLWGRRASAASYCEGLGYGVIRWLREARRMAGGDGQSLALTVVIDAELKAAMDAKAKAEKIGTARGRRGSKEDDFRAGREDGAEIEIPVGLPAPSTGAPTLLLEGRRDG